jgi:hypothetical protein
VFHGSPPATITNHEVSPDTQLLEPYAQNGGHITGRIAGNIVNSVLSASVDPNPSGINTSNASFEQQNTPLFPFGAPDNLVLPQGSINVKFEGTADNSTNPLVATSAPANAAFFANHVTIKKGPVIPPSVPYQPYRAPTIYHRGQVTLRGVFHVDHIPANLHMLRAAQASASKKK